MGYTAHVRTESHIKYGTGYFNRCDIQLANFLSCECPSSNIYDDNGYPKSDWEIQTVELQELVDKMEHNWDDTEIIFEDHTAKDIRTILKQWLDTVQNNPNNYDYPDWVNIDWF